MKAGAQLLRVLHLASPALPVGAFHFSQGLEYAVEAGWVRDGSSALEWIGGLAHSAVGTLDLPILLRLHRAWTAQDTASIVIWSRALIAARETEELRTEDRHTATALLRILKEFGIANDPGAGSDEPLCYAARFAQACVHWGIEEEEALQAYLWAWAENQTLAAVKLVPLGQSAGQRILHSLIPDLKRIVDEAFSVPDRDIGTAAVMQGIASARHEMQYTRLFKS